MNKPKILVVGSLVMDLIVSTPRFPNAGETVLGTNFETATGGKGANQAVQMARLGADVTMVGMVGNDSFGKELVQACKDSGINTDYIMTHPSLSSAVGNVQIEKQSDGKTQNRIVVVSGANFGIKTSDLDFLKDKIAEYDMVVLQLEIPMDSVELVAKYAHDKKVPVMLNSAPSAKLSTELLSNLTYISPNEHEAADITGLTIGTDKNGISEHDVYNMISSLREKNIDNVLITLGSAGAAFGNDNCKFIEPVIKDVAVADPTAAGDSFVGAFCVGITSGLSEHDSVVFANHTASITVSKMGAQPSLPTLIEVKSFMEKRGVKFPFA